jgi:hypothetical protein
MTLVVLCGLKVLHEPDVLLFETPDLFSELEFGLTNSDVLAVCHEIHYYARVLKGWLRTYVG